MKPKRTTDRRLVRFWPVQEMEDKTGFRTEDGAIYIARENSGGGNRIERANKFKGTRSEKRQIKAIRRERRLKRSETAATA